MAIFRQLQDLRQVPGRVVSLVPSITESLFDLGLGDCLVGISDQCTFPQEKTECLPRVGGTKSADPHNILALEPDLVLANQEENARECILTLAETHSVWLAFPHTVQEAMNDLWNLVYLLRSETALLRMRSLQNLVDLAENAAAERVGPAVFVPIWWESGQDGQSWWMTFNNQTYCGDLIRLLGGKNIFAERQRRYPLAADLGQAESEDPGERDTRYPRVSREEILAADPQVVLYPDEPFNFSEVSPDKLRQWMAGTSAARNGQIFSIDGSLITWHGTRIARALEALSPLFFT